MSNTSLLEQTTEYKKLYALPVQFLNKLATDFDIYTGDGSKQFLLYSIFNSRLLPEELAPLQVALEKEEVGRNTTLEAIETITSYLSPAARRKLTIVSPVFRNADPLRPFIAEVDKILVRPNRRLPPLVKLEEAVSYVETTVPDEYKGPMHEYIRDRYLVGGQVEKDALSVVDYIISNYPDSVAISVYIDFYLTSMVKFQSKSSYQNLVNLLITLPALYHDIPISYYFNTVYVDTTVNGLIEHEPAFSYFRQKKNIKDIVDELVEYGILDKGLYLNTCDMYKNPSVYEWFFPNLWRYLLSEAISITEADEALCLFDYLVKYALPRYKPDFTAFQDILDKELLYQPNKDAAFIVLWENQGKKYIKNPLYKYLDDIYGYIIDNTK